MKKENIFIKKGKICVRQVRMKLKQHSFFFVLLMDRLMDNKLTENVWPKMVKI